MRNIAVGRWVAWLLVTAVITAGLTGCSPPQSLGYVQRTDAGLELVTCYRGSMTEVSLGPQRVAWEYSGEPAPRVLLPAFIEREYEVHWAGSGGAGTFRFDARDVNGDTVAYLGGLKTKDELFRYPGYLYDCKHKP